MDRSVVSCSTSDGGGGATGVKQPVALLLPVLPPEAAVTPEIDKLLTAAARAAREGDRASRDALFFALQPKILRSVQRCYRWSREQSAAWDRDDLDQEVFLLFVSLLAKWPGSDSFAGYFFSRFPHRLHDLVRREAGFRPSCPPVSTSRPKRAAPDVLDEVSLERLTMLAEALSPAEAELLLMRVRDRHSFEAIAVLQHCHTLTVRRHWRAMLPKLRQLLAAQDWA